MQAPFYCRTRLELVEPFVGLDSGSFLIGEYRCAPFGLARSFLGGRLAVPSAWPHDACVPHCSGCARVPFLIATVCSAQLPAPTGSFSAVFG